MSQPPPYSDFDSGSMSSTTNDDRSHPGKFDGLDGFLRAQRTVSGPPPPNYNGYREVQFVNPEPGAIIHIIDRPQRQNSPLHQRVMLVIRHEDPSPMTSRAMTCIPLCIYEDGFPKSSGQYWSVQQEGAVATEVNYHHRARYPGAATPSSRLSVSLYRNTSMEDGITANLGELWRVEYDHILVDKIGQVSNGSLAPALSRISELFVTSLKTRQHKPAKTTRPAESQKTRVFTVGNPWDGHYVRKRQH